ncbi:MAG: monovalent cation/H(+) antiporter subunit G [Candidatus Cloacimonadaceae bacterium]|nr:monovalent cation/H(+) antiporter subunit G [Candidatus Cloacimonadaceae bacterium]
MMQIIGAVFTLLGSLLLFLGALGILRMPDVYNRMQAGTKATSLGSMLALLGIGLILPNWLPRLILLILFILFTNPISSHAMSRAAHRLGIKLTDRSVRDELAQDRVDASFDEEECNV